MPKRRQLPIHRRITLDEFLAFTGWEVTPGVSRTAMGVALDFEVIKLSELMQAIDFRGPVERLMAHGNRRFKCFRPRNEPKSQRPRGNWFTDPSSRQEALALPGAQDLVRVYVVKTPVQCLKSPMHSRGYAATLSKSSKRPCPRSTSMAAAFSISSGNRNGISRSRRDSQPESRKRTEPHGSSHEVNTEHGNA